jgi:MFS family permease
MWAIPYALFIPYASLYQERVGLSPAQIGLLGSVTSTLGVISAFFGAHLVDRVGRKRSLLVADFLSWPVACAVWAFAGDFRWFLVAAVLNGVGSIAFIAWSCLLVEDTAEAERFPIFSWLQVIQLGAGLFVPLAAPVIAHLGVVSGTRLLYLFAIPNMAAMMFIRDRLTRESSIGLARMSHARAINWRQVASEYRRATRFIVGHPEYRALFVASLSFNLSAVVSSLYVGLYYADHLLVAPAVISVFPTVTAAVMLASTIWLLPSLDEGLARRNLSVGSMLVLTGLVTLISTPTRGLGWVVLSVTLSAAGNGLVNPFYNVILNGLIEDADRATVLSATFVIRTLLLTPVGAVAGFLFSLSPRLPFIGAAGLIALGIAVYLPFAFGRGAARGSAAAE